MAERLGLAAPEPDDRTRIVLYGSHESKALAEGSISDLTVAADGRRASAVVEGGVARADGRCEAQVALRRAFGTARHAALEIGATLVLADDDTRAHWRAAAAWVEAAGESTPLDDLLDESRFAARSRLLNDPLAAVAVEALLDEAGVAGLRHAWGAKELDIVPLRGAYREALEQLVLEHDTWIRARRAARGRHRGEVDLRGVCFAHEGYAIHDGYASSRADRSLGRARSLGADAVSLTPFGSYRNPNDPSIRWRRRTPPSGRGQGSETDEALLVAGARARAHGMSVMLKPHLWGHGWCGEIEMTTPAAWDEWFATYGEFLVHHALLAETGDFEWLSIGCELVRTTRDHDAEWRGLAGRARRLFAGGVTYSANWGDEMEQLAFADALDAVGVNCYFPIAEGAAPTETELRRGATAALARIAALETRYGRPVILTEVGYPVRERAWHEPYRGHGDEASDPADQARCLNAFALAFRAQSAPRVRGFYFWKWPTLERWDDRDRVDFWPASDAAIDALRDGFR